MEKELEFFSEKLFKSLTFDKNSDNWTFVFEGNIWASSSGFWRLLKDKEIMAISLDHNHQFGLPQPLNLISFITEKLKDSRLTKISVDKDSGDLKLILTNDYEIQIFISSIAYETLEFFVNDKMYIGLGGGKEFYII